jgi:hypothetical protein
VVLETADPLHNSHPPGILEEGQGCIEPAGVVPIPANPLPFIGTTGIAGTKKSVSEVPSLTLEKSAEYGNPEIYM